jgi:hypothetical protein
MTTTVSDNPQVPSIVSEIYQPDQLIAGKFDLVTSQGISLTGAAALKRGTVLGRVTLGAASSAAKAGGNTGGGALTLDATTPILASAKVGVYTARCIATNTNSGTFEVKDPDGRSLGQYIVGATFADQIKFVIADGTPDFALGDGFDITIAAGSNKFKKSVATAVDGSQNPNAILADDADATGGDVNCGAYLTGEFNSNALIFDGSWTVAALTPLLRALSIFLRTTISSAAPS